MWQCLSHNYLIIKVFTNVIFLATVFNNILWGTVPLKSLKLLAFFRHTYWHLCLRMYFTVSLCLICCGLVDYVRLKREYVWVFSFRADSKWKSIFVNIYNIFEVVFLWKLKINPFPVCLPYLFLNYINMFENFHIFPSLTNTTTMTV